MLHSGQFKQKRYGDASDNLHRTYIYCSILFHIDFWVFGNCLGLRESEIERIWNEVYGKFDKAMLILVVRVLQSEKKVQEVLATALTKIENQERAQVAAKGIKRGKIIVAIYNY